MTCALYYAERHFPAHIFAKLLFTCTVFPPSSLLPSLTPFNPLAYRLLLSSLSLGLLSYLQHQNSVSEYTFKSGLVTVGRRAGVPVLTLWINLSLCLFVTLGYVD